MASFEGNFFHTQSLRFGIVVARFNDLVVGKLLQGCQDALKRHGVDIDPQGSQVDYVWVPGSFEVPMVARQLALSGRYHALICLGAVIRGQTPTLTTSAMKPPRALPQSASKRGSRPFLVLLPPTLCNRL